MSLETIVADINWYEVVIFLIGVLGTIYGYVKKISAKELEKINNRYRNSMDIDSVKGRQISGSEAITIVSDIIAAIQSDDSDVGK